MKRYTHIIYLLGLLFFTPLLHAQVAPVIEWQKCLGGSGADLGYGMQQTADHGYVMVGEISSDNGDVSGFHGYYDYWVIKVDSVGNLQWQNSLGGTKYDDGIAIQQASDGGYIVAGGSYSNDGDVTGHHGQEDYWVVKLDAEGNIVWEKSLGGDNYDKAFAVCQTTDGGFMVAGVSNSNSGDVTGNHGDGDFWVVKLDSVGTLMWQKSLGGSDDDDAYAVQPTSDNGCIVAGYSSSNDGDVSGNHGGYDYWVVKLDALGNTTWKKCLGGSSYDYAYAVQQTTDGGFIVAGYSGSNNGDVSGNHGNSDYWVVKLDTAGDIQWQKCLGGSSSEDANSIRETVDGGFVVAGYSYSANGDVSGNHGGDDYWIVKLDAMGNLVWQKCLGGNSADVAYAAQQTADGGFIAAGYTYSNSGDVSGNHGSYDYWIVKLTSDIATSIPAPSTKNISLYPNPAQDQLNISFPTPVDKISIHVYDLQGRIQHCGFRILNSGLNNSITLETENLADGFYTLQIINNKTGEMQTENFVKQQ